ncbi:hypothetical protein GCM10018781_49720 [Kitasatospora indigofera]|uniref:PknH-like extracellular domain-containing protein n=1 Tax=Kitasatospora indigofera TaxID=67307 RepID=A0A919G2T4_9ACTN|nr:hypothetical protein [Kitasatospora indigofera]GHH77042.1 hypothetical protein GCM10018781_49720 [Kitasatospora indigofera]
MPLRPARRPVLRPLPRPAPRVRPRRPSLPPAAARRAAALACALLLAGGCTTVGVSADRVTEGRALAAAELRAAALTDGDLGPGYIVTVMTPGHGETGPADGREVTDLPACQPVLDAVTPANAAVAAGQGGSPAPAGPDLPIAETDLSVATAADPRGSVYAGLLAYRPGRAAELRRQVEQVLASCGSFTSTTATGHGAAGGRKGVPARHRLSRVDTPTTGGADAVTGFTLTNESGGVTLTQRAVLARVGSVLAVFSTVGVGAEPASAPDERVVRQQVAKLRAAQRGG